MGSFVLHGNIIDSESPERLRVAADSYLVCEEGRCTGVFSALPERFSGLPLTDFGDRLILPGMTDLHLHAPQFAFRGLGMDLELLDWLNARTFPEEAKYADLSYAALAYGQFVDCLRRSATTRAVVFGTVHPAATTLLMELLEASGLVSYVGKVNMDRDCPEALREADAAASLAATERWLASARFAHTKPILTPRFVPSCSDALLQGLGELAARRGLPVQSHLSENLGEIALVQSLCPQTDFYAEAYDRCGLLSQPCIMAHCVHCPPEEQDLLQARGVFIAHSPLSNSNLSSGVAPVSAYLARGLRVGLGSDLAAGETENLFRVMAEAIRVSKLRWRLLDDTTAPLTVAQAFYLATRGGGAFFGEVGCFEPGFALDAVVLDDSALAHPQELTPIERLERCIYLADERHIAAKYVAGTRLF